jgi:hypothetical protein
LDWVGCLLGWSIGWSVGWLLGVLVGWSIGPPNNQPSNVGQETKTQPSFVLAFGFSLFLLLLYMRQVLVHV